MAEKKTCFVIAPIGEPDSETRRRSDQILKHVITPAAEQCGYEPIRADQISEPGIITSQVIQHTVDDELAFCLCCWPSPKLENSDGVHHGLPHRIFQHAPFCIE